MKQKTIFIVAGLGFGDEGKGTITEFLCKNYNADFVVRYNGGPQAAHHVVTADNQWHCFSQFGSASFQGKVHSHLAHSMLVKPSNLLVERDILSAKGAVDIESRFTIDSTSYLVTPWHAMLGQMEESSRGADRHGSVGMGVGKAAHDRRTKPTQALKLEDLTNHGVLKHKLSFLWEQMQNDAYCIIEKSKSNREVLKIFESYTQRTCPEVMYSQYCRMSDLLVQNLRNDSDLLGTDDTAECLVLEGAQGALLDFDSGFLPHVTKTDTSFNSANAFLRETKLDGTSQIKRVGVLRSYATRHGAGPFVTHDRSLSEVYPEPHNLTHRWQGDFRVGHFDLVASRYAIKVSGGPDYLALTHLDSVGAQERFHVCDSYCFTGNATRDELEHYFELDDSESRPIVKNIRCCNLTDVKQRLRLTQLLTHCSPHHLLEFKGWGRVYPHRRSRAFERLKTFLTHLESPQGLQCPIKILSFGPKLSDKTLI